MLGSVDQCVSIDSNFVESQITMRIKATADIGGVEFLRDKIRF